MRIILVPVSVLSLLVGACVDDSARGSKARPLDTFGADLADSAPDSTPGTGPDSTLETGMDVLTQGPEVQDDTAVSVERRLKIVVEGSAADSPPDDELAGQTPDPYFYGLVRMELLTGADDPGPELIFDHHPEHVLVDMHGQTTVAEVPLAVLPHGSFPLFRITLSHVHAVVLATLHGVPVVGTLETPVTLDYALSTTHAGGLDLAQGEATASVTLLGSTYTYPIPHESIGAPAPGPTAWSEDHGEETRVTFGLPTPLLVTSTWPDDVTCTIRFQIAGSMRWQDDAKPGHTAGKWDVDLGTPPAAEPILRFGANGWEVRCD